MLPFLNANKVFAHPHSVDLVIQEKAVRPVHYEVSLTNACNLACPHCCAKKSRGKRQDIDKESLIGFLYKSGCRAVTFAGHGDPTLYPVIFDVLGRMRDAGIEVGVFTNGIKWLPMMTQYCDWVRFSVDATNADDWARIHHAPARFFGDVVANIKTAAERGVKQKPPTKIGVQILISAEEIARHLVLGERGLGYNWAHDAVWFWRDLGVDTVVFKPLLPAKPRVDWTGIEEACRIGNAEAKVGQYRRALEKNRGYTTCWASGLSQFIRHDGEVFLCCNRNDRDTLIGTIEDAGEKLAGVALVKRRKLSLKKCPLACRHDATNLALEAAANPPREAFVNFV